MEMNKEVIDRVRIICRTYYSKFTIKKQSYDDMTQEIYLKLLETKYLDNYDETKPLHNYLSGFIFNHFCMVYRVEGYVVERAMSIYKPIEGFEDLKIIDTIASTSYDDDPSFLVFVDFIADKLDNRYSFSSFVAYNLKLELLGVFGIEEWESKSNDPEMICFPRAASVVFKLISIGMTQADIKGLLVVSKSWVSKIVKRISEFDDIRRAVKNSGLKLDVLSRM